MNFIAVYYEPEALNYEIGLKLKKMYSDIPWNEITSHNRIDELRSYPNSAFTRLKRYLIIGIRKTHKYTENQKISDFLVPFTSSGCTASCLYCYLVCNYNKCSYLRLFVNREMMLDKLCSLSQKMPTPKNFEIGSNSDLILENSITENLEWTIPIFAREGKGCITFPTKFHMVDPLLHLDHKGKTIFRMSVNPQTVISNIELGTSSLKDRIEAVNKMHDAGYPCGILIAPVILLDNWRSLYENLINYLSDMLSPQAQKGLTVEIIFMTYSYIHRAINEEAFPSAINLYDKAKMKGKGPGKYQYEGEERKKAEIFITEQVNKKLPDAKIIYIC